MKKSLAFLIFVLSFVVCLSAESEDARNGVKRALLVAVDEYMDSSLRALRTPVKDVEAMVQQLHNLGFQNENIVILSSEQTNPSFRPTHQNILNQIEKISNNCGPKDVLFILLTGHGVRQERYSYFCAEDTELNSLRETGIQIEESVEDLTNSEAAFKWLVMEACRNITKGVGFHLNNPPEGVAVLQSCAFGEKSRDMQLHSMFMEQFLQAFQPENSDKNHDGLLTFQEICDYAIQKTREVTMDHQNPTLNVCGIDKSWVVIYDELRVKAHEAWQKAKKTRLEGNLSEATKQIDLALANFGSDEVYLEEKNLIQLASHSRELEKEKQNLLIENGNLKKRLEQKASEAEVKTTQVPEGDLNSKAEELFQLGVKWATADHGKGKQDWKLATEYFQQAAELGHARAMVLLGECYEIGRGVGMDLTKMLEFHKKAAELNEPRACYCLGLLYEEGKGVDKNEDEAKRWFAKSFEVCLARKDSGDPWIQYLMGICYQFGQGTAKDEKEALRWYRMAAEKGDAQAQTSLGFCYQQGVGTEKDSHEAVRWFEMAAKQSEAVAQHNLGFCYQYGLGVEANVKEAVHWTKMAAEQGDAWAQNDLGNCYFSGVGVDKNEKEAVRWFRMSAERGNPEARNRLGFCYQNGIGIEKNEEEAVRWYRMAAEQGNTGAQRNLGYCLFNGIGVKQDKAEAEKWYQKAENNE